MPWCGTCTPWRHIPVPASSTLGVVLVDPHVAARAVVCVLEFRIVQLADGELPAISVGTEGAEFEGQALWSRICLMRWSGPGREVRTDLHNSLTCHRATRTLRPRRRHG